MMRKAAVCLFVLFLMVLGPAEMVVDASLSSCLSEIRRMRDDCYADAERAFNRCRSSWRGLWGTVDTVCGWERDDKRDKCDRAYARRERNCYADARCPCNV